MKTNLVSTLLIVLFIFSCKQQQLDTDPVNIGPKVAEAKGYVVPRDSMAEPKVVPVDKSKLTKIRAGIPKFVPTNTNVHPSGKPQVVPVGTPRICTPGTDTFLLPQTVMAIGSPFLAGMPEIVVANDPTVKDNNPNNFSSFGVLQGLTHEIILKIIEDKAGNLWFSTQGGGVSKYDGKFFTHFTEKEGLSDNQVQTMLEDRAGNLWFCTRGSISKYDGKFFTHFTEKEGFVNNYITSILEDRSGNLWFGIEGEGACKYDGKTFTYFTRKEGLSHLDVTSILEDKAGNLWFGTDDGGVNKFDGQSFTHFTEKEGLSNNSVWSIVEDRSGNLWFGTWGGGVCKYDGQSFTHFTEEEGLSNNYVESIKEDRSGNLWVSTDGGGVNKFDGQSFTHFTENEGFTNAKIFSILEDKSGALWFGTMGDGVIKYNGKSFSHLTTKEGLSNNVVGNILEDRSGNLWLGTYGGGVNKYTGNFLNANHPKSGIGTSDTGKPGFFHFTENEGLSHNEVWHIMQDRNGNLWLSTNEGVSKYDGKFFTNFNEKNGLSSNFISNTLEDKSGNIWICTRGAGVSKFDGKAFTHFSMKEGLSHLNMTSILEDQYGNLWFGTSGGGVNKYEPAKNGLAATFTHFTEKEGLSNNSVWSMVEDHSGNIWFITNGGVDKYQPAKDGQVATFTHFTEKEGLSNSVGSSILEDRSGNLWIGTINGLNQFVTAKFSSLVAMSNDSNDSVELDNLNSSDVYIKTYTYVDGFTGMGCYKRALCQDRNGTIWIGAFDRLTAYHPEGDIPDTIPPNMQLTGISMFNERIPWPELQNHQDTTLTLGNGVQIRNIEFDSTSKWYGLPQNLSLRHDNNYLTFNFIGITQKSPKKVKYQYTLEGNDENWSAVTPQTEAHYGNLSHGSFIFKVKAMNSEGYWSNVIENPFIIRPPWWHTWWSYSLYGLVILTLAWRVHRYLRSRTIRIEREKTQQKELAHAKEIESAYTELKSTQAQLIQREKMASLGELTAGIAHEIQNPLNFVNNFSEVNSELIAEMKQEVAEGNFEEVKNIANAIDENEQKIIFHGKRADAIVKGMLQHSRSSSGVKEPTDINALTDEYLRLAYHGLRAKDKSFNATFKTDFDKDIGLINIVPQEIGRVILNLITNAFYTVSEKNKQQPENYQPTVKVVTKKIGDKIEIRVSDNGNGIPQAVLDKIFQPFFTTKPTGQGTGLGLSLSYDIIKAHGGEINVETKLDEGTTFSILLIK